MKAVTRFCSIPSTNMNYIYHTGDINKLKAVSIPMTATLLDFSAKDQLQKAISIIEGQEVEIEVYKEDEDWGWIGIKQDDTINHPFTEQRVKAESLTIENFVSRVQLSADIKRSRDYIEKLKRDIEHTDQSIVYMEGLTTKTGEWISTSL